MARRNKNLKSRADIGVQQNRLYSASEGNEARQTRIRNAGINMRNRIGKLGAGALGGEFKKFTVAQRMGLANG